MLLNYLLTFLIISFFSIPKLFAEAQLDTHRFLVQKANSYIYTDPNKGLEYALKALEKLSENDERYKDTLLLFARLQRESRNLDDAEKSLLKGLEMAFGTPFEINFLGELGLVYYLMGKHHKSKSALKKALILAEKFGSEKKIAELKLYKTHHYVYNYQWDSTQIIFEQILPIAKKTNDKLLADTHFGIAYHLFSQNKLDTAKIHYLKAIERYNALDLPIKAADVQRCIASLEFLRNREAIALEHLIAAEEIYSKIQLLPKLANVYNLMAKTYKGINQFEKASDYFDKALYIYRDQNLKNHEAFTSINAGILYAENLEYSVALNYFDTALNYFKIVQDSNKLAFINHYVAEIEYNLKNYDIALARIKEAKQFFSSKQNTNVLFENFTLSSKIYHALGQNNNTETYLSKARRLINQVNSLRDKVDFYTINLQYQISRNNPFLANKALNELLAAQKKLSETVQQEFIADKQVFYETTKKEEQLKAEIAKTNTMIQVAKEQEKVTLWVTFSALSFLAGLLFLAYFFWQLKIKSDEIARLNQSLATKNDSLEEKHGILKGKNEKIKTLNSHLKKSNLNLTVTNNALKEKKEHIERLHLEMNHRIKNNLTSLASTFSLQVYELEGIARNVFLEAQGRIHAIGVLHDSLCQDEKNPTFIDVQYYIPRLLSFIEDTYKLPTIAKKFELEIKRIDPMPGIDICLVFNEIINNAMKYAFPDHASPALTIKFFKANDTLHLHVQDNGPGLPVGFNLEDDTSLGMSLIWNFVKKHNGICNVINENGVRYEIAIPEKSMALA